MFANALKIALRHLRKRKGYAFINIFGLAVGLACTVLILLYVQDELSYDRFHDDADRIYRVAMDAFPPGTEPDRFAITSRVIGRTIRSEYPEVDALVRMNPWEPTLKHDGRYFYNDTYFFVEPSFFDVFTFPLVQGDPATALDEPFEIVLTESTARKYFGDQEALGQALTLNDSLTFTVTGIAADVPANAHFSFDFLVSYETLVGFQPENDGWLALGTYTYIKLQNGTDAEAFEARLEDHVMRHAGDQLRSFGFSANLLLQPLTGVHLHSDRTGELGTNGDVRYVYVFSIVALFVLLIASINFMNLATARSMERAREVGVRKVMGSSRSLLVRQFLSESLLMCLLSLGVALVLIAAALPFFNDLSGKDIAFGQLASPVFVLGLLGLTVLVGLLAGSYPAFFLSGFRPIHVLKGSFATSRQGALLRRTLVVAQFTISVVLIISTLVVFNQLSFMQDRDLGFDKEQVVVIDAQGLPGQQMAQQYETARRSFLQKAGVQEASASWTVPGRQTGLLIVEPEDLAEGDSRRAQIIVADHYFTETLGLHIVAGRDFDPAFETDVAEGLLINQAAVSYFGWAPAENALGKRIQVGGKDGVVVGVVEDFHFSSLKQSIEPLIIHIQPQAFNYFALRVDADDSRNTVAALQTTWDRLFPGYAFDYFFLDTDYDRQYEAETRLGRIFGAFSTIAIVIACLGLFGLATFMAEQRTKEIGIRKVLGASIPGIVGLLSKDFTFLVLVAVGLATPIAFFGMRAWLDTFPYHTALSPSTFVLAGTAALAVALLTVSYQAIRAAVSDPVNALRYE